MGPSPSGPFQRILKTTDKATSTTALWSLYQGMHNKPINPDLNELNELNELKKNKGFQRHKDKTNLINPTSKHLSGKPFSKLSHKIQDEDQGQNEIRRTKIKVLNSTHLQKH